MIDGKNKSNELRTGAMKKKAEVKTTFFSTSTTSLMVALLSCSFGVTFLVVLQRLGFKWTVYLLLAPFVLLGFYLLKSVSSKVAVLFFLLIFVEKVILSQRNPLDFMSVGVSLVFLVVILCSLLYSEAYQDLFQGKVFVWLVFLITPLFAVFLSQAKGYSLFNEQIIFYQVYFVEFFLFFLLGSLLWKRPEDIENIFFFLILLGGLAAILHILSLVTGFNLEAIRGVDEVVAHRDLSDEKNWRYGGVFGNPNTMSAYYVMIAPAGVLALSGKGGFIKKFAVFVCIALMSVSLVFAGSRGGLLFGLLNLLFAFCLLRVQLKSALFIFLGFAGFFLLTTFITDLYFYDFLERAVDRYQDRGLELGVRREIWSSALLMLKENLFGIGLHWSIFSSEFSRHSSLFFVNPHNIFLSIALFGGVVGLLAFLSLVFRALNNCIKIIFTPSPDRLKLLARCCLVGIVGFMVFGITEPIFSNGFKLNHLFAFMLGCATAIKIANSKMIVDMQSANVEQNDEERS